MKPRLFVGTISGTSVDGIDLALLQIDSNSTKILASATYPLSGSLEKELKSLATPGENEIDRMGAVDSAFAQEVAMAILRFIKAQGLTPKEIEAIGSHGQTIRHRSSQTNPFTLQIGDPNLIAEITGISTVADFRRRDMAAGGQGAPLVPLFHEVLFAHEKPNRVILNIGGIANITYLSAPILGFDTGPGNGLMDAWISRHKNCNFDEDGNWGATGTVNKQLLAAFLRDPYFALPPPKSTGREDFQLAWVDDHKESNALSSEDVQATLVELTATSVARATEKWATAAAEVIVMGGGRLNSHLMQRLKHHLAPTSVFACEQLGLDGDGIEAAAFAWLAYRHIEGLPGNAPTVTGAKGERVLGAFFPA